MVTDLTHYLYSNNMLRYIEGYVQKVNPAKAPQVVGGLLDAEAPDEFVNNLILSVRSLIPVEQLCAEVTSHNIRRPLQRFKFKAHGRMWPRMLAGPACLPCPATILPLDSRLRKFLAELSWDCLGTHCFMLRFVSSSNSQYSISKKSSLGHLVLHLMYNQGCAALIF